MPSVTPIQHPDQLFIGGKWAQPAGTTRFDVLNSSTEELFVSVAEAQAADMSAAVSAARQAFDHGPWPRMREDSVFEAWCCCTLAVDILFAHT